MKHFVILLTAIVCTARLSAQTPEDSVRAAINRMFTGIKNADTVMLRSVFSDSMVLQTITMDKAGQTMVVNEPVADFISFVSNQQPGDADERIVIDMVKIDGPLAIAWTPYEFYYKGRFSHCGVNSFQLVKLRGVWRIQYIIDTRRRQGCK
jgi:hypothetical protein